MSVLSSIGRIAARYSLARSRYRTERELLSLPFEVQKDIGWPEISDCTLTGRHPAYPAARPCEE
ncbi:MAG: hypothetical protein WBA36_04345 [Mesorhizobium sp.]